MSERAAARLVAFFLAALVVGLTIRHNTFAAWATDSGAYLSAAQGWARGELFTPASFLFWAPWAADGQVEFPLGHVQGPVRGTITGQYPLGYPLLLAAAIRLGDDLAPHLVSPLLGGVLTWCAFLLGRRMAGGWAGVLAALMMGATPVALNHAVMPFSDVPATAFWALAWVMAVRPGHGASLASGLCVAFAVTIRPNLAPLGAVIAACVVFAGYLGWRRALTRTVVFGLAAAVGPLLVLWSQAALYGDPFQSGYRVPMDYFFKLERVPVNASLYVRTLGELHSWAVFGGLIFAPIAISRMRRSPEEYEKGVLVCSALGMILVNYALYLPYLTYVGWYWLRFLLPALLALFLLLAAGLEELRKWIACRWPRVAVLAFVPAVVVVLAAEEHLQPPVGFERILLMQRYLPQVLPANAVILTYAHGGALAAATGRPIVRIDYVESEKLDGVVRDLRRRGMRPVYVFDVAIEADFVGHRFRNSEFGRLTWPARAELASVTSVVYYDIADREAFASGDRFVTDVLPAGRSTHGNVNWADLRTERERILLPLFDETAAFRTSLETIYREQLARSPSQPAIDAAESLRWLRRYLRLRLHECSHEAATARVWQQLEDGRVPALCAAPDAVRFPPEDEASDFHRQLAERLRDRPLRQPPSAVDALGEVVWTERYLAARVEQRCSHEQALHIVAQQIAGTAVSASCNN